MQIIDNNYVVKRKYSESVMGQLRGWKTWHNKIGHRASGVAAVRQNGNPRFYRTASTTQMAEVITTTKGAIPAQFGLSDLLVDTA